MTTITRFATEQLTKWAKDCRMLAQCAVDARPDDVAAAKNLALAEIALASLDAKARKVFTCTGCGAEGLDEPLESRCHCGEDGAHWVESFVYTAPPAPVSEIECDICGFKSTDPDGAHYCCEDNSND